MEIHKDTNCIYLHTKASNRVKYREDADRSPAASKYIQVAHTCHVSFALVHEHRAAERGKKNNEMITFFNTIIRRLRTATTIITTIITIPLMNFVDVSLFILYRLLP